MVTIIEFILTIILIVEFIVGNLGNGFIAQVSCMDWLTRKISSVDQILTTLAVSRMFLFWSAFIIIVVFSIQPALLMTKNMLKMIMITWTVTNHFSIWLATSLSIIYFLKIANFSNSVFLYLKWRVKKVVSVMLLFSTVPFSLNIVVINTHIDVWIYDSIRNISGSVSIMDPAQLSQIFLCTNTIFTFVPFVVSLTTFLLLILSLWMHLKKMRVNFQGSRDVSTRAHVKAMQTVITFLILYTVFFLSFFIQIWNTGLLRSRCFNLFCQVVGWSFPAGHSCALILQNSKLRQAARSVLKWLQCRSRDTTTV